MRIENTNSSGIYYTAICQVSHCGSSLIDFGKASTVAQRPARCILTTSLNARTSGRSIQPSRECYASGEIQRSAAVRKTKLDAAIADIAITLNHIGIAATCILKSYWLLVALPGAE